MAGESVSNLTDRTEAAAGPYATGHRLARSFRIQPGLPVVLGYQAPIDLRIDGAFSELHSAPAYWLSPDVGIRRTKASPRFLTGSNAVWGHRPEGILPALARIGSPEFRVPSSRVSRTL